MELEHCNRWLTVKPNLLCIYDAVPIKNIGGSVELTTTALEVMYSFTSTSILSMHTNIKQWCN